jgi:hypothetical protein
MRASAMIIQTNEIEKARYQYQLMPSNNNDTPSTPAEKHQALAKIVKSTKQQQTNKMYLLMLSNKHKTRHIDDDNIDDIDCDYDDNDEFLATDEQTTTNTSIATNENNKAQSNLTKILKLTQERLSEHDKVHAQTSGHNGQYTNQTRDYIIKWTNEYQPPKDEKPFPVGQIPLDIYGHKVSNSPQYLNKMANNYSNSNNAYSSCANGPNKSLPVNNETQAANLTTKSENQNSAINSTKEKTNNKQYTSIEHNQSVNSNTATTTKNSNNVNKAQTNTNQTVQKQLCKLLSYFHDLC